MKYFTNLLCIAAIAGTVSSGPVKCSSKNSRCIVELDDPTPVYELVPSAKAPEPAVLSIAIPKPPEPAPEPAPAKPAPASKEVSDPSSAIEYGKAVPASPDTCPGMGVLLTNLDSEYTTFSFFKNFWDGNGAAGANFVDVTYSVTVKQGDTVWVPLKSDFKGTLRRGDELPATFVEFQVKADDGIAWGDVSVQQGYDGPATIHSTDGHVDWSGFKQDAFEGAPLSAYRNKPSGRKALEATHSNWMKEGGNADSREHLHSVVGHYNAYVEGPSGTHNVISKNNCFRVVFY